jgi:hypothetical protein
MHGVAGLLLVTLIIPSLASSPQPNVPRVIVRLSVPRGEQPQVVIENAAPTPTVLSGVTYLSLSSTEDLSPRYWARLDTEATPSRHGAIRLSARGKLTASVKPADLLWAADRSGMAAELPLGRAVLPGTYNLQVQMQAPDGAWWRSNEVQVTVGRSGSLRYR